ncbi:MAG: hypothetical protein IJ274_05985 [Lachnospiraceae bacterium]|nr:hypothetical protein [Lachnospiraceae bacterium]
MLYKAVEWLKELTVFMVICETILSFSPTSVYKRYIKPFVGLIMLLWITSFLFGAIESDWNKRIEQIFTDYERAVSHYLENIPIIEEERRQELPHKGFSPEDSLSNDGKLNEDIIKIEGVIISPIKIGEME